MQFRPPPQKKKKLGAGKVGAGWTGTQITAYQAANFKLVFKSFFPLFRFYIVTVLNATI